MTALWRTVICGAAALLGLAAISPSQAADPHVLVLGAGEAHGVFYSEAGAVCRIVNRDRQRHGLRCLVEPSGGSAANIQALRKGDIQLAMVQSRTLADALAGTGAFAKEGPFADLRSLFSLSGETVAVLLPADSKIKTPADLKGKRVNLGRPGGYQRSMAEMVLEAEGLKPKDMASALEMEPEKSVKAVCDNQLDAAIITGLHPVAEIQEALDDCGATLLPLKDAAIETYIKATPSVSKQFIGAGDYTGLNDSIQTIGARTVLVTSSKLPDADGYELVKAVLEYLGPMKNMTPLLLPIDKKQMTRETIVAPFHAGAARYYKEVGLP